MSGAKRKVEYAVELLGVPLIATFEETVEQHARYTGELLRERSPLADTAVRSARATVVPARHALGSGQATEALPLSRLQPA